MSLRLLVFLQLTLYIANIAGSQNALLLPAPPTVKLDRATVIGSTNNSVTTYLGIPFAQPPVGDLRLRLPQPIHSYNGSIDATRPPTQCLQLNPSIRTDLPAQMLRDLMDYLSGFTVAPLPMAEDCLNINVQVPEGTKPNAELPVVAYIYGGGFTVGSNWQMSGDVFVRRSVEIGKPVIFVAMNYRLHAFGFLGGKEVREAGIGNLGLHDQREALRWIQKYISAFGGDPNRVTLWGLSAGAASSTLQMLTNDGNTEGLFHGAVMNAGSPWPSSDTVNQQPVYDTIIEQIGCSGSQNTLACLRNASADSIVAAANTVPNLFDYSGLATPWAPHADGVFLKAPPQHVVLAGNVANIPFMTGDALDEGTMFATGSWNITTEEQFEEYVHQFYFPRTPKHLLTPIFSLYPNDPTKGSPFGTGHANQLAPMYKRMAAFQGDVAFQAPRRFFLDQRSSKQPTWSFISQRNRAPGLGFPHSSDLVAALLMASELADYIIQFATTGDPNGASNRTIPWPRYNASSRPILSILQDGIEISEDTSRLMQMAALSALSVAYPM